MVLRSRLNRQDGGTVRLGSPLPNIRRVYHAYDEIVASQRQLARCFPRREIDAGS